MYTENPKYYLKEPNQHFLKLTCNKNKNNLQ